MGGMDHIRAMAFGRCRSGDLFVRFFAHAKKKPASRCGDRLTVTSRDSRVKGGELRRGLLWSRLAIRLLFRYGLLLRWQIRLGFRLLLGGWRERL
jgi:hypothetical protein